MITDYAILLRLEDHLRQSGVGQELAVQEGVFRQIAKYIRKGMAGLRDPRRPIATFVFLGPESSAKEQLARAIAGVMFGDEAGVLRVASNPSAGTPMDESRLAEAVRLRPSSVIVFDEIEKASPGLRELYFQIRDEGWAADETGSPIEFRDAILIALSSVGSRRIAQDSGPVGGQEPERLNRDVLDEL